MKASAMLSTIFLPLALLFATSLGDIVSIRLANTPGDEKRILLYEGSIELAMRSPVLGWGSPVELSFLVPGAPPNPPIGTHGQFWLVMVSNGLFPGLLAFLGWFVWAFYRTGRRGPAPARRSPRAPWVPDGNARFWCHVAILVAIVEMPYYELIPWGLPIVMAAAAVAFREQRADLAPVAVSALAGRPAPIGRRVR